MTPEDAEEYTQSLGQIVAGSWRQVAWAHKQGIPAALGLSTEEWVQDRLGGYVRLAIPERREAVRELSEDGMSQRQIASVLGVDEGTVRNDKRADNSAVANQDQENSTPDAEESAPLDRAEGLLQKAAEVAELLHTIKTERRPTPPPVAPPHPAAGFLWARLSEVRGLDVHDATDEQRQDLIDVIGQWSEQISRLDKEVRG